MPDERSSDLETRHAQYVLLMVHELHKRGYQRLRIVPGMAPSGLYWRCSITPITNTLATHGAMPLQYKACVHYTTGMGNGYFGWTDAKHDIPQQLAAKFVERFPEVVRAGLGSDWNYAGWYVEMLGFAKRGCFPIAYSDWQIETSKYLARDSERELPLPPAGEAEPLGNSDL